MIRVVLGKLAFVLYCWILINHVRGMKPSQYDGDESNFFAREKSLDCSECLNLLMKSVSEFLLSEYNRVETTNQNLYLQSRDPYVLCNEYDKTSCFISMEIRESECDRFAVSKECRVVPGKDTKSCIVFVNPYKIKIESPLMCQTNSEETNKLEKEFSQFQGSMEDFHSKLAEKIIKKQWGRNGGNIFPF